MTYKPGKRQNTLEPEHIKRIVETYQFRPEEPVDRYARRVSMDEIEKNGSTCLPVKWSLNWR